ncbi:hypothetical protein H2204_011512 [Knufia peltigerae]|uniref:Uncharacterized protein n=1 Tax=Knufia peltigerae TaxID=1002370 RepID=A0AA38XTY5_9EURO|nr:hypothetical protein H2204_011512 [Knufia peltigerae]
MCYYARTDYSCGDWRWGNMKLRCQRQHRMGETCGAKLADEQNIVWVSEQCRTCKDIEVKQRRLQRELDNIARWQREGDRFRASIEKAQREARQLREMIDDLQGKRASIVFQVRPDARPPTMSDVRPPRAVV